MKKQMVAIAAAMLATAFMSGCGDKKKVSVSTDKKYTYHAAVLAPNTWNPTDWKNHEEDVVLKNVCLPLYDFVLNETKDGYDIIPEMAAEMPVDVTSEYAGNEIYGVPAAAKEGYAFKVKLNPLATWQDGTKINADTYIYSLKQFLNPEMKNFRASSFYSESLVIANAKSYYDGGIAYDNVKTDSGYADVKDDDMWSSLSQKVVFFDDAIDSYNGVDNPDEWKADDGSDLWAKLKELAGDSTYFKVNPEVKSIYQSVAKKFGDNNPEAYKEFCFSRTELPPTPWENVGIVKNDDYTITFILGKAYTPFMFLYNSGSVRLVYEPLYEANKKKAGDIIKSSYGTTVDNFASYGPYKIVDYQADKYMKLERNENWYGYTDGKHDGQFQTTGWDFQYITDQPTRLNLFLQGKLDGVELSATDMDKYGNSEYRLDTPRSYTWKFSFNIDRKSLKKENTEGVNHTLIANKNFRHGVSLSLDRQKLTDTIDIAKTPAYGLISYLYIAEPETGLLYRNTEVAKNGLMKFYGTSSVEDITGYNLTEASKYFQKAYDEEIAAGELKESDKIQIDFHTYSANESTMRRVSFLQDAINAAAAGTSLEGKITIKQVTDQNYYENMRTGSVDLALTAWGGSAFDPYGVLWCYAEPSALNEYGFNPKKETVKITLDGKEYTRTYYDWYQALTAGEYSNASYDIKNTILSGCEVGLLSYYNMIPLMYDAVASLNSQRVIEGTDKFINEDVLFGDCRFRTFTMDDAEWDAYCTKQNNQLKY